MKKLIRTILGYVERIKRLKRGSKTSYLEALDEIRKLDPDVIYNHYLFKFEGMSKELIEHRNFFKSGMRGFGEDAFHAFWFDLISQYKPTNFLEIGVYRGQTVSLWLLISELLGINVKVAGLSPFEAVGDSVSEYISVDDYQAETLINCSRFSQKKPRLCKAYSNDSEGIEFIRSGKWDLIYIDGSHDFSIVKQDYEHSRNAINSGGFIVFDDSGLSSKFDPGFVAFKGHPGPSKLVDELIASGLEPFVRLGHLTVFRF